MVRGVWIIRVSFKDVGVERKMLGGGRVIAVKERLVDFHLRDLVVRPNNSWWGVIMMRIKR